MKYFKSVNEFLFWGNDKIEADKEATTEYKPITWMAHNDDVKRLQESLEALGFKLSRFGIDSKFGPETLSQVKSLFYLIDTNKDLNNLVKGDLEIKNNSVSVEQQSIIYQLSQNDKAKDIIEKHYQNLYKQIGSTELVGKNLILKNIEAPEEFTAKLYEISKKLQINPNWLIIVMWKESKINPKAINPTSGASGLIQFMPKTAQGLGTSVEEIRRMTGIEQLDFVYKYFENYTGKIKSVEDLYMVTFYPVALGKDDDANVGGATVAKQNKVVDLNSDGQITVGEFKDYVNKGIPSELKNGLDSNIA